MFLEYGLLKYDSVPKLKGFEWLTSKVRSGDRRFFYCAWHTRDDTRC